MRPYVGLQPTIPQYAAGRSTEPTVWLPMASGTMPAATAAAEPLELPPGVCSRFQGLRVGAGSMYANCVVCVLPRIAAPAALRRATAALSADGVRCANAAAP